MFQSAICRQCNCDASPTNTRGLFGCKILFHDTCTVCEFGMCDEVRHPRTAEDMTSRHNILPECGMTDFSDAGRFVGQTWRRLTQYTWHEMAHSPPA